MSRKTHAILGGSDGDMVHSDRHEVALKRQHKRVRAFLSRWQNVLGDLRIVAKSC
jgi:hypothetical protein